MTADLLNTWKTGNDETMVELAKTQLDQRGMWVEVDEELTAYLRPMSPDDKPLIAKAIRDLTSESRRMRFFYGFSEAPDSLLNILADVDGFDHIAWGALDVSGPVAKPIAVVHAVRTSHDVPTVEIACTVLDAYRRHGLARVLLTEVLQDCMELGNNCAVADVLTINEKARSFFQGLGAESIVQGDTLRLSLNISRTLENLTRPESDQPSKRV